jgi:hypothetical protein
MMLCIEPNERRPGGGSKRGGQKGSNRIELQLKRTKDEVN